MPIHPLVSRPWLALCHFLALLAWPVHAQEASPSLQMRADLAFFASDEREGRSAETKGLRESADYISQQYKEIGLQTALFDGEPFQNFSLPGPEEAVQETNQLSFAFSSGVEMVLRLGTDYLPQTAGKKGEFNAPLLFAGYGITARDPINYDDYHNQDASGKVVIVLRKEPRETDPNSPFDGTEPSEHAMFSTKEVNAFAHGAVAVLFVNNFESERSNPGQILPVSTTGTFSVSGQIPTLFLRRACIDELLQSQGISLSEIEKAIDLDLSPRSFDLPDVRASGNVQIKRKKIPSYNVLGLLPGSGALAEEFVVLGAHFDHVGMGGPGSLAPGTIAIHNGADDNASGTASLLESARRLTEYYKNASEQAKRNIVFIAFSGEERGMLGSVYYCDHPRFPLEKTIAMLNLDMVGRLNNNALQVFGTGTAKEFNPMLDELNERYGFQLRKFSEGVGPSDHQSFFLRGIPVLHFFTGFHTDYHRPSDDFHKINLSGMDRITDMVSQLAFRLATEPRKLEFVDDRGRRAPKMQENLDQPPKLRLGVQIHDLWVDQVVPGSLADQAGVLAGDQLLKINDVHLESRTDIERVLQAANPGEMLAILVNRNDTKVELKVAIPQ